MQITIQLSGNKLVHAKPEQYGAIVAYVIKSKHFHNIQVFKTAIAITFNLGDFPNLQTLADQSANLEKDIWALLDLEPYPCPCGCGQFLAIGPCFVQANEVSKQDLTPDEIAVARGGLKIQSIKMVRDRLKCDLLTAKEMVDKLGFQHSRATQLEADNAWKIYDIWNNPHDF